MGSLMEFMVSSISYRKREVRKKVKNKEEYLGMERAGRKEEQIEENIPWSECPPVHTHTTVDSDCGHY